jgi:hypothetical protein
VAALLSVQPTTLAGALAMLKYATDHIDAGYTWPDSLGELKDDEDDAPMASDILGHWDIWDITRAPDDLVSACIGWGCF